MTPWMEPITDASAWTAEDLKRDESWKFTLTDDHRSDLDKALKQVNQSGLQFGEIKREDFSLPYIAGNPSEHAQRNPQWTRVRDAQRVPLRRL